MSKKPGTPVPTQPSASRRKFLKGAAAGAAAVPMFAMAADAPKADAPKAAAPAVVSSTGGKVWAPNFNNIDASSAKRAHDAGLQLVPWTVNETADMRRLIDWGVDGIITDYPDRLREVMRERGLALPPGVAR